MPAKTRARGRYALLLVLAAVFPSGRAWSARIHFERSIAPPLGTSIDLLVRPALVGDHLVARGYAWDQYAAFSFLASSGALTATDSSAGTTDFFAAGPQLVGHVLGTSRVRTFDPASLVPLGPFFDAPPVSLRLAGNPIGDVLVVDGDALLLDATTLALERTIPWYVNGAITLSTTFLVGAYVPAVEGALPAATLFVWRRNDGQLLYGLPITALGVAANDTYVAALTSAPDGLHVEVLDGPTGAHVSTIDRPSLDRHTVYHGGDFSLAFVGDDLLWRDRDRLYLLDPGTGAVLDALPVSGDLTPMAVSGTQIAIPTPTPLPSFGRIDVFDVVQSCGDGVLDRGEACDDGNLLPGDGCSPTCRLERCGDGVVDPGEACDDGNRINGDGCDDNCTPTGCGNGIRTEGEECDDGNGDDGDDCTSSCRIPRCGNGVVDAGETCDDGNRFDGDGCDGSCRLESLGDLRCYKIRQLLGSPRFTRTTLSVHDADGDVTLLALSPELYCAPLDTREARGMTCYKAKATPSIRASSPTAVTNRAHTTTFTTGPLSRLCVPAVRPGNLVTLAQLDDAFPGQIVATSPTVVAASPAALTSLAGAAFEVDLFSAIDGGHLRSLTPPPGRTASWGSVMAFAGSELLVGGGGPMLDVFDVASGLPTRTLTLPVPVSGGFTVGAIRVAGQRVIVFGAQNELFPTTQTGYVIDLATGAAEHQFASWFPSGDVTGGTLVFSSGIGAVGVLDLASGAILRTLTSAGHPVADFGISITAIGDLVAIGAPDTVDDTYRGRVEVWNPSTGQFVRMLSYPADQSVNPAFGYHLGTDGSLLSVVGWAANSPSAFLFDPGFDADLYRQQGGPSQLTGVRPGVFADDRSIVGIACGNGTVDAGEDCDDGNRIDGDSCPASCSSSSTRFLSCYKTPGLSAPPDRSFVEADAVGFETHTSDLGKFDSFCRDATVAGVAAAPPAPSLLCYRFRDRYAPKIRKSSLQVHDWFGDHLVQTTSYAARCLPSLPTPP